MKMNKTLWMSLAVLVLAGVLSSCGKKTADEIFEEQKGGVVLVLNKFYYKVEMPGGQQLFFNGIDQNETCWDLPPTRLRQRPKHRCSMEQAFSSVTMDSLSPIGMWQRLMWTVDN